MSEERLQRASRRHFVVEFVHKDENSELFRAYELHKGCLEIAG